MMGIERPGTGRGCASPIWFKLPVMGSVLSRPVFGFPITQGSALAGYQVRHRDLGDD
jgi:hypothetical protein